MSLNGAKHKISSGFYMTFATLGFLCSMSCSGCDNGFKSTQAADASALSAASDGGGSSNSGPGVVAISANTFLSSTGVNTHIDQGYSGSAYVQPLIYLGVRNIRDGYRNLSTTISVHQQTGVFVNIGSSGDLTGVIAAAKQLDTAGALLSVEGPNEPNNFTMTYQGQTGGGSGSWLPVADFQRDLYAAVKGDATLNKYPVFHVSEGGAETSNVGMQFLTIPAGAGAAMPDGTQYADYANPHNYVSSTSNEYVNNMAWNAADPTMNAEWDGLYVEYGKTWDKDYAGYSDSQLQTLPRVTTETGWDSTSNPGGETVQGKVLVNTYLSQFKRGWRYTFIYELVDAQGSDGDQGLFHADFSAKLGATYIHNMTTILADTGTLANPAKVNYTITNEPTTVHDLLLQKSSGPFELVVWDENVSSSDVVNVSLGATYPSVKIYDVTTGTAPTQTLTNVSSVTLSLTDHAMIVEIGN